MKNFFREFKKFITRGNVLDMAVGVIVGGAFTAIVNGLTNNILKPLINYLLSLVIGQNGLEGSVYFLSKITAEDGTVDLAKSIFIDWGAFITAIINFLLIALVLFIIVRAINRVHKNNEELKEKIKASKLTKEQKKELKANGIKLCDREKVKAYLDEKAKLEEEKKKQEELEAQIKAEAERKLNPTTEDLLKQILAELKARN